MSETNGFDELYLKYPMALDEYVKRDSPFCENGFELGERWIPIIEPIIKYIDEYNRKHKLKIEIEQIKSKYGELIFITNTMPMELWYKICEINKIEG